MTDLRTPGGEILAQGMLLFSIFVSLRGFRAVLGPEKPQNNGYDNWNQEIHHIFRACGAQIYFLTVWSIWQPLESYKHPSNFILAMVQARSTNDKNTSWCTHPVQKHHVKLDFCNGTSAFYYWQNRFHAGFLLIIFSLKNIFDKEYQRDSWKLENTQNIEENAPQARRKIRYFWRKSGFFGR